MSEPKWTKGPWRVHEAYPLADNWLAVDGDTPFMNWTGTVGKGKTVIATAMARTPALGFPMPNTLEEGRANTLLIAASPELYEALKDILDRLPRKGDAAALLRYSKARNALAKARGEA